MKMQAIVEPRLSKIDEVPCSDGPVQHNDDGGYITVKEYTLYSYIYIIHLLQLIITFAQCKVQE